MPTLDDAPIIAPIAAADLAGADLVQVFSNSLRKPKTASITSLISANSRLSGYGGVLSTDVGTPITTDAQTIASRLTVFSGRSTATAATLPAAAGTLRNVIIVNTNTGTGIITVSSGGGITGNAAIPIPATGVCSSAQFLSNGTIWYRVS